MCSNLISILKNANIVWVPVPGFDPSTHHCTTVACNKGNIFTLQLCGVGAFSSSVASVFVFFHFGARLLSAELESVVDFHITQQLPGPLIIHVQGTASLHIHYPWSGPGSQLISPCSSWPRSDWL